MRELSIAGKWERREPDRRKETSTKKAQTSLYQSEGLGRTHYTDKFRSRYARAFTELIRV